MDYKTKAIGRKGLRRLAVYFRRLNHVEIGGPFPVLEVLEFVPDVFPGSIYIVVEDDSMDENTMARCMANDEGGYTVEIKKSVYDMAYMGDEPSCGFICHELCHVFLFSIGYTPIVERSFANHELPAYCSVEWQAKALCGEVMIPFGESAGMGKREIVETYHVSWAFADYRHRLPDSDISKNERGRGNCMETKQDTLNVAATTFNASHSWMC